MKNFLRFVWILIKKRITYDDLMDWWLLLFHNTCVDELKPYYSKHDSDRFYRNFPVTERQYNMWKRWVFMAVRRSEMRFYWEGVTFIDGRLYWGFFAIRRNHIGWISWSAPSKMMIKRDFNIWLNCAPTVKNIAG